MCENIANTIISLNPNKRENRNVRESLKLQSIVNILEYFYLKEGGLMKEPDDILRNAGNFQKLLEEIRNICTKCYTKCSISKNSINCKSGILNVMPKSNCGEPKRKAAEFCRYFYIVNQDVINDLFCYSEESLKKNPIVTNLDYEGLQIIKSHMVKRLYREVTQSKQLLNDLWGKLREK